MPLLRRLHFVTFGAGADNPAAARRLAYQAKCTRLFSTVACVTETDFFSEWPEFEVHWSFIAANPRGWGYWLWKPLIVNATFHRLPPGDALVYFDAGCELLPGNERHLARILGTLDESDAMLLTYAAHPEFNVAFWTKQNLLDRAATEFGLSRLVDVPQVWAGSIGLVNAPHVRAMTADWARLAIADGYTLLDDTPSPIPQRQIFFEHRRDQSILSLLVAAYHLTSCGSAPDFEYGVEHIVKWPILLDRPFLGMRNRTGQSQIESLEQGSAMRIRRRIQRVFKPRMHGWSHDRAAELRAVHGAAIAAAI